MNTEKVLKLLYMLYKKSANARPFTMDYELFGINDEIHILVLDLFPTIEGRNNFNKLIAATDGEFYLKKEQMTFEEFKNACYE